MASTSTDIANRALTLLGSPPISALNDGSREAVMLTRVYDDTRLSALRSYPWAFARTRAQLTTPPAITPPANAAAADNWTYQHTLPANLRIIQVDDGETPYEIEGGFLYTDSDTIDLRYVQDVTDVTKYDPLFIEVFAHWLAWGVCMILTQDNALRDDIYKALQLILAQARNVAANENFPQEIQNDTWISARKSLPLQNFVRDPKT